MVALGQALDIRAQDVKLVSGGEEPEQDGRHPDIAATRFQDLRDS
jgi:hypothetical protein